MKTQKFSNIKVEKIVNNAVALLHQKVQTTYTSTGGNSKSDGIYDENDFEGKTYDSDRYTLVKVPSTATVAETQARVNKYPDARIYRVMAHNIEDVMTEEQLYMVESGQSELSMEDYMGKLLARDEKELPLEKNGKQFYRALYFSTTAKEDIDLCGTPQSSHDEAKVGEEANSGFTF